jgi:ketosteroid isomerase-like protein
MSLEENKELVRRFLDWWSSGDVSVLDRTVADDVVSHAPGGDVHSGREVLRKRLGGIIGFFSKRQLHIEDLFAEGDRVAVRYWWSGVTGDNRNVKVMNMAIYRIANGRLAEEWEEQDTAGFAKQLGGS